MPNLLSTENKKIVRSEYSRRLISVAIGGLLFVFVADFLLLIPFLVNIYYGSKNAKNELDVLTSKPASNDYRDLENIIKETKSDMNLLKNDMSQRQHIANVLTNVIRYKPNGISIEDMSWSNDDSGIRLNLGGIASTRELLRKYVTILQSDKSFPRVDIPVSAFAKAEKADFVITITVADKANEKGK